MYLKYNTFLTPHLPVKTLATMNVETVPKLQKHRSSQTICEDVHELGCRRHVQDTDMTDDHAFLHKVEVDLDMLRALVLNAVGGEVDGVDVVVVDEGALRQRSVELLK
jgi:hypothetical protein